MTIAEIFSRSAAELALFAGVGFLLFAVNDLAVDLIYFARRMWRAIGIYSRHQRAYASYFVFNKNPGLIAVLVPAWDESAVIASMLKAMLRRLDYDNYRIFVGHYRNDPATAAAIASVDDPRIEPVEVPADGPTTKADCLNYLYDALVGYELGHDCAAKAIVLHDAEDVVHRYELRIFDGLIDRAAVVQLPVLPLPDPHSRWIAGHYCDEFAEAHLKELVVREAVGAAIPLAGVGCAIERRALSRLAALQDGKPFAPGSMTEDYELGLKLGALGLKTMFVRIPAQPGDQGVVAMPSGKRPVGSVELRSPVGIGSAGAAAWANAGCGCATVAARSPRCCCWPPTAPRCSGRSCGSPKRSVPRSRLASTRAWLPC